MVKDALFEVLRSGNFDVLDTETTGLDKRAEVVSIAVIGSNGLPKLNTLVHPTHPIPADATRVHGITNEMVKNALPFPSELLANLIADRDVVIYNAQYDVGMLYQATEWAGLPYVDWRKIARFHCAMERFSEIYGEWNSRYGNYKWKPLSTAAHYYKVTQAGAHGALVDCQTTLAVCKAMVATQKV